MNRAPRRTPANRLVFEDRFGEAGTFFLFLKEATYESGAT